MSASQWFAAHVGLLDNYQGDESDIVIVSLTRGNHDHDIGFMSSPERINVLLSKAQDTLIMIGNMETFRRSKDGDGTWGKLFELLEKEGHIYDGLPVQCKRHADHTALLPNPEDFESNCPDGGCTEPWYVPLPVCFTSS